MPDEPITPEPAPAAPEAPPVEPPAEQNQQDLPQWARDAITKANKEAANYRTQVAELKPRADQFAALEEASKSEAQRLSEAATNAQREAETARAEAVRYKAAATFGIPADHFDLLGSGTEEEITARAEKLQALLAIQAAPPGAAPVPTRPLEQMRPGATPSETDNEDDVMYARLFGAPQN